MDRKEYLKKYKVCPQCLGEYKMTMKGLEEHIYNSVEHDRYIKMIMCNRAPWWKFW